MCMNVIAAHSKETLHATEICEQPNPLELPLMWMGLHPLSFNMIFKENYGCLDMAATLFSRFYGSGNIVSSKSQSSRICSHE